MDLKILAFEVRKNPLRIGAMVLLASFTVQTGVFLVPGFALVATDTDELKLLKPRSDRAYRLRFASKEASETLLDMACDRFKAIAGIAPEDVAFPAVPGARDAIEQEGEYQ